MTAMPFTAKDVKCTFDLLQGKGQDKFRKNPRKDLFSNITEVTTNGDFEVTLHLKRPQPSLLAMIASGYTPMYSCHVPAAQMRTHPIGTGPFKFVEFKQNESIKLTQERELLEEGPAVSRRHRIHHHLEPGDGGARLRRRQGRHDLPDRDDGGADRRHQEAGSDRDLRDQADQRRPPISSSTARTRRSTISNCAKRWRWRIDRKAFIDIIFQGQADAGGTMLPGPEGVWGMPPDMLKTIPGYGDVAKDREQARAIMTKLGYSASNPLKIKVSTRNLATYRDPAVVLIDQLKTIWIDAELDPVESSQWFAKVARNDYSVGLNLTGNGIDDPDQAFYENYACGSERNYTHYCNKDLEALFDKQSVETDLQKRKQMVWDIDKKLQEDVARPILMHARSGMCWKPYVKNMTIMSNSAYNGYRYDDVWLDK